ncbi:MAG TPA: HesA/MoeB/ThiF family protein [Acidilobales archaeon]|nr:HesA/MoeB/ThiF family protein [Acidilobales archaeon]
MVSLSNEELERYSRQIKVLGVDAQKRLKSSKVLVVGAGGLGSAVLTYLTAIGVGEIKVIDKEVVELSNLNRQIIYDTQSIGMPKVDVVTKKLRALNPNVVLKGYRLDVLKDDIDELVKDSDIIIDCLDNWGSRLILNKLAIRYRKPLIHAGIEGFYGQLMVVIPKETPCLSCIFPKPPKEIREIPVVGTVAGLLGILEVNEAIKVLTGVGEVFKNRLLLVDLLRTEFTVINVRRNPRCPVCSK